MTLSLQGSKVLWVIIIITNDLFIQIFLFLVKHGTPSNDELEELGSLIGGNWRRLGRRLCITDESLEEIEGATGYDLPEKGYRMLRQWKQQCGSAATYKVLCEALKHKLVKRQDLAVTFCYINGN